MHSQIRLLSQKDETVIFHYYQETDSLYIELSKKSGVNSQEVASGVVLDFDNEGHVVGIDLDQASKFVDLSRLEAISLPIRDFSLEG